MSTTTAVPSAPPSSSFTTKQTPQFEFPKRKRWADLLLTEIFDDVAFVLSKDSKILFCGLSITEILGWKDVDLIDLDFFDLIDDADQQVFRAAFEESIHTKDECTVPMMLKASPTSQLNGSGCKDTVLDIKLYPHTFGEEGGEQTTCVFVMTSPSPNRDMAMLATILDLNTENLILQQKVAACRERLPLDHANSPQTPPAQGSSMYVTSTLNPAKAGSHSAPAAAQRGDAHARVAESKLAPVADAGDDATASVSHLDDQSEDGSRKKKPKRVQALAENHVCKQCGRTDSPEWRKGPDGPKTLCNACGLRHAKKKRQEEEPAAEGGGGGGPTAGPTAASDA